MGHKKTYKKYRQQSFPFHVTAQCERNVFQFIQNRNAEAARYVVKTCQSNKALLKGCNNYLMPSQRKRKSYCSPSS